MTAQTSLQILAHAAWVSGEHGEASRHFRASLLVASVLADRVNAAYCMQGLAVADWTRGQPRRAACLLGAAEGLLEAAGVPLYAWADHELYRSATVATREKLGRRAWEELRGEGRAMTFEQAVEYALDDDDEA